jgi:hypothetical protein
MNQVATKQAQQIAATPADLLQIAVQSNADIDKLEKLMNLQQRWEESEAKKAFFFAMSGFQSKLEPIIKKREAHNSKYADIDDIAQAIRPLLAQAGLSYRFEQEQGEGVITVTCIVTHEAGHCEKTTMTAMYDTSGGKNAIQSIASSVTYLRRYTLTGALGITTGQDDSDGGKPEIIVDDLLRYNAVLREEIHSIASIKMALANGNYSEAKESIMEMDENTQTILWRAPSKGGIFTTEERGKIKSNEFSAA